MTIKDYLLLSWMAYLDLPPLYSALIARGGSIPVSALADTALRMDAAGRLRCVKLNEYSREAAREMLKSDWLITDHVNNNRADGFAAYVVKAGEETVVAMRGSERMGECAASNVDWIDNVCEPFAGSVQLDAIRALVTAYPEGRLVFTGHSKGGHNALSALAVSGNPNARAVAFNAQGFSTSALTPEQKAILGSRGENYVVTDDVIGALLEHPERRVYARRRPGTSAHMPEAFVFDGDGAPVKAARALRSYAVETATRLADAGVGGNVREAVGAICRLALQNEL